MLDRDALQMTLRDVEIEITEYDLAKQLGVSVEELLTFIQDNILPEYKDMFNNNAYKIPAWKEDKIKEFFEQQIIDIGFLCQSKIIEIRDSLKEKHNTFAHQTFYNNWVMYRGY